MLVDLMHVTTSDGIRLGGAFFEPPPGVSRKGPVEAILLAHGSRGNFYEPGITALADTLRAKGYGCLAMNTTAHDTVWFNAGDGTHRGNAFDILDRCRLDLRAGIDYLWQKGYRQIGLLGVSMGAVRVAYYCATERDERVAAVIPISPVRLSYSYYMESEDAEEFKSIVARADHLEAEGRAQELMDVKFPIQQLFSAASYLDKHGPAERYNLMTLAPKITVPMFILAGSLETHTRLRDMARDLSLASVNSPSSDYLVIEGGNHGLSNRRQECVTAVLDWLGSLTLQRVAA